MYVAMVLLLGAMGLIFTIFMLVSNREQPIFGMLALITWLAAAGSVAITELPYTHLYDNAVDNSYVVVEGIQQVTGTGPLAYLFLGFALFCFAYVFIVAFRMIQRTVKV